MGQQPRPMLSAASTNACMAMPASTAGLKKASRWSFSKGLSRHCWIWRWRLLLPRKTRITGVLSSHAWPTTSVAMRRRFFASVTMTMSRAWRSLLEGAERATAESSLRSSRLGASGLKRRCERREARLSRNEVSPMVSGGVSGVVPKRNERASLSAVMIWCSRLGRTEGAAGQIMPRGRLGRAAGGSKEGRARPGACGPGF
jgi:hypothetical protein